MIFILIHHVTIWLILSVFVLHVQPLVLCALSAQLCPYLQAIFNIFHLFIHFLCITCLALLVNTSCAKTHLLVIASLKISRVALTA